MTLNTWAATRLEPNLWVFNAVCNKIPCFLQLVITCSLNCICHEVILGKCNCFVACIQLWVWVRVSGCGCERVHESACVCLCLCVISSSCINNLFYFLHPYFNFRLKKLSALESSYSHSHFPQILQIILGYGGVNTVKLVHPAYFGSDNSFICKDTSCLLSHLQKLQSMAVYEDTTNIFPTLRW